MSAVQATEISTIARWSAGGAFLETLAKRDFTRMAMTLGAAIRFRALLPRGLMEWEGPENVAETFKSWFGGAEVFQLLDATVGEVSGRLHLSWRIRLRPAPFGEGEGWHVIEQQAYADADESIETLDLLCSGFNSERVPDWAAG